MSGLIIGFFLISFFIRKRFKLNKNFKFFLRTYYNSFLSLLSKEINTQIRRLLKNIYLFSID